MKLAKILLLINFLYFVNCSPHTIPYEQKEWREKGITSLEEIELGNVKHSILIRGTDKSNPILLVIHGFAVPMMPFAHLSYGDKRDRMEKNFIIVNYDQRGVGKTSRLNDEDQIDFTMEDFVYDAEILCQKLMKRFGKKKIYLQAISWGSYIGAKLAAKHPDWFYAYISEGQAVYAPESIAEMKRFSLEEARLENNVKAIEELEAAEVANLTLGVIKMKENMEKISSWGEYYQNKKYKYRNFTLSELFIGALRKAPEYSFFDFLATLKSMDSFSEKNISKLMEINMRKEVPEMNLPVYFLMGEYDFMNQAGRDYFTTLKSPKKKWIELKRAGHELGADQPEEVQKIYIDQIRKETFLP
ncbi:alpha/beta fold hydrolase [Leptospira ognonensis]|uniref:alpha/beta fold hydrolase n=1 Tax=Leptospira ognonensis TaxID=2484945 RepID=UPI0014382ACD|nr:alpha/beta hydrolase [Leptospira ognonensis]